MEGGGGEAFLKLSGGGGKGILKLEKIIPEHDFSSSIAWSLIIIDLLYVAIHRHPEALIGKSLINLY